MRRFLRKFLQEYGTFFRSKQVSSFFVWMMRQPLLPSEVVYIQLPLQEMFRSCSSAKEQEFTEGHQISFVVCEPVSLPKALKNLPQQYRDYASWFLIYYSQTIEIWENKKRHTGALPLRFGLTDTERKTALQIARESIQYALEHTGEILTVPESASRGAVTVDVVLWVAGELRGSYVAQALSLQQAVATAACFAARGDSAKPLSLRELPATRIEIQVLSDVCIELSEHDIECGHLDGRKCYGIVCDETQRWYFPATFNCVRFQNLQDLFRRLFDEKIAPHSIALRRVRHVECLVHGCIDGVSAPLVLDGTVAVPDDTYSLYEGVRRCAHEAADWLLRMHDADGYIPLMIDPLTLRARRTDWARMACAAQALAEYGMVVARDDCRTAAARTLRYVAAHMARPNTLPATSRLSILVYLGMTALVLGERATVEMIILRVRKEWRGVPYGPILYSSLATFFCRLTKNGYGDLLSEATEAANSVYADFLKQREQKESGEVVRYAELVHTLTLLFEGTKDSTYDRKSKEVTTWIEEQKLENGAFSTQTHSRYSHTRAAAKLFEVYASDSVVNISHIKALCTDLFSAQYSEENSYFVTPSFRQQLIGGFRYDSVCPDAWIDAAGHFIIGAARMSKAT